MKRRDLLKTILAGAGAAAYGLAPKRRLLAAEDEEWHDVIVVGGGISGLTAGYLLKDREVVLLEANDRVGGRTVSGIRGGWSYAKGTEYLGEPEDLFARMIRELDLEAVEIPSPMDMAFRGGRYYAGFGQKSKFLIDQGGLSTYNTFIRTLRDIEEEYDYVPDYDPEGPLGRLDHITARAWFDEMGLPPVYHETYNIMARGLFGANLDEVSALGAFEEIAFDFEGAEPITDMEDLDELATEMGPSGSYSFVKGITEVTNAIAGVLGDRIRMEAGVTWVEGDDEEGYEVTYRDADGAEVTIGADAVIVATPLPITLEIAEDILSEDQAEIIEQIPYAPYMTAALFSDEPIFERAFDLSLPDGWYLSDLYDATWVQRRFDPDADDYKGYIAGAYIAPTGYTEPGFLDTPDDELIKRVLADVERVSPGVSQKIKGYDIHRHKYAYPVAVPGTFERLAELHETLEDTGFQLAGDGVVYPTFQTAIIAGEVAADRVLDWL